MSTTHVQNIGSGERVGRIILGAALAVLGAIVAFSSPGFWGWAGAVLAVAAGIDLIVTGARGYCPLYARFGHVPRSLQGTAR